MFKIILVLFSSYNSTKRKSNKRLADFSDQRGPCKKKLRSFSFKGDSQVDINTQPSCFLDDTERMDPNYEYIDKEVKVEMEEINPDEMTNLENESYQEENRIHDYNNDPCIKSEQLQNNDQSVYNSVQPERKKMKDIIQISSEDRSNILYLNKIIDNEHNYESLEKKRRFDNKLTNLQNNSSQHVNDRLPEKVEDVENEEYLTNIIERTKSFSLNEEVSIHFGNRIKKFINESALKNIYRLEITSLFRFYYYYKCKYSIQKRCTKIFNTFNYPLLKEKIYDFLENYIINDFTCVSSKETSSEVQSSGIHKSNILYTKMKDLAIDFNTFLTQQTEKFGIFYIHSTSGHFLIPGFADVAYIGDELIKKFILYAIKKVLETEENLFITYLFPEIHTILKILAENTFPQYKYKYFLVSIGFIVIKTTMLKVKLIKELEISKIGNVGVNYTKSEYFCKYILDIRCFLLFNTELLCLEEYDKRFKEKMFLITFLSYFRLRGGKILKTPEINEFLFFLTEIKEDLLDTLPIERNSVEVKQRIFPYPILGLTSEESVSNFLKGLQENNLIFSKEKNIVMKDTYGNCVIINVDKNLWNYNLKQFTEELVHKLKDK